METPTNTTSNTASTTDSGVSTPTENTPFPANPPPTKSLINYFQLGTTQYKSALIISEKENRVFHLRGSEVSSYLKNVDRKSPSCLSFRFTKDTLKKVMVLAGAPQSYFDFNLGTLEYYYSFEPANTSKNKNNCQTTNIVNNILLNNSDHQIIFDLSSLCTENCSLREITSDQTSLETTGAVKISDISVMNLLLNVQSDLGGTYYSGSSCSSNTECTTRGFDCCSAGICVKDKSPKPGVAEYDPETGEIVKYTVEPSSIAQQIKIDLENNPQNIFLYPEYFYFCQEETGSETPTIDDSVSADEEAAYA